jgi:hypothetical protein
MGNLKFLFIFIFTISPCWSSSLKIASVFPDKICYKPGEVAKINVEVINKEKVDITGKVSVLIRYGLDGKDELSSQTINVHPGGKEIVKFNYPIPKRRKWGHEIISKIIDEKGNIQSTAKEYFTVGDNPWELGHYMTCFFIRGKKKSGEIDKKILEYRKQYITAIEGFSWQPSVFDEMTPDTDFWRSGQGGYAEGKEDWQYLIQKAHENGMIVVTYIQSVSYGPVGLEFMRKHPDWWRYSEKGNPDVSFFYVDRLASLMENPDQFIPSSFGCALGLFLPNKPQVGDYWINEVINSVKMFGWDGIRSDGNPGIVSGYDYKGDFYEVKDTDKVNAYFLEKVRQKLTEKYPDFRFGWNYYIGDGALGQKQLEKMVPGSYMLWEAFRGSPEPSSPLHNWKRMVKGLHEEVGAIRKLGGFSHQGWMPSNRYLEAIVSACGGHIDGWGYLNNKDLLNYRRFQFRWSEFLWDNSLRYVDSAEDMIKVEVMKGREEIWWKDFVHTKNLLGGGKRVILHLINMPEKDDDAWADRPPEPVKDIKVEFGVQKGKKPVKIIAISPDIEGDIVPVNISGNSVILPEVKIWSMVIAEYGR